MKKKMFIKMIAVAFLLTGIAAQNANALEVKKLWEKEFDFKVSIFDFDIDTGKIIVGSKYARKIIVFDKDGNITYEWGPRIDRQPFEGEIANKGDSLFFVTTVTEEYVKNYKDYGDFWDFKLHHIGSDGKEKWVKYVGETLVNVSYDGSLIALVNYPGSKKAIQILNDKGEIVYTANDKNVSFVSFDAEGKYFAYINKGTLYKYTSNGELQWKNKKTFGDAAYLTAKGTYILDYGFTSIPPKDNMMIYDIDGNEFYTLNNGRAFISRDENLMLVESTSKKSVYALPEKKLINEFDSNFVNLSFIGADGLYVHAKDKTNKKSYVVNIENSKALELPDSDNYNFAGSTYDGKYLILKKNNSIKYFLLN